MKNSIVWSVGKYLLGFALLAYVIQKYWQPPPGSPGPGLAEMFQRPVQYVPLVLAVSIGLVSVQLTFVRWYVLVRAQGLPFSLTNAFRLGMVGYFASTFLPGSIGGDVLKAAFLAKEQSRRTVAVATVLLDRALGLWGLIWLVAMLGGYFWLNGNPVLLHHPYLKSIVFGAMGMIVASLLVCLLLEVLPAHRAERFAGRLNRIPKVGHFCAEFWRAIWMYHCQRRQVALALLLAMIGHVGFVLTFFYAAQIFQPSDAVGQIPTLAEHFLIVPIGMCIQAVPLTPGGVGVGEWVFGWLYEQIGKSESNGVFASLAQRVISWALGLVGYLIYLRMKPSLPAQSIAAVEEELASGEVVLAQPETT